VRRTLLVPLLLLALAGCARGGDEPGSADSMKQPVVGTCRQLTPADIAQTTNSTPTVSCKDPHTAETYASGTFPASVGGLDDEKLGAYLYPICHRKFQSYLGGDESLVLRAIVTWAWFRPSKHAWSKGARWYRCDVVGGGEQSASLVQLPADPHNILLGRPEDRWMVCADGPTVSESPKVPCTQKHTWRAVTTIVVGGKKDAYPGDKDVEARTRDYCSDSVGAWLNYPVDYDYGYTWFHAAEWKAGNRRSICWAQTDQ
jgi:hypothetical protein